MGEIMNNEQLSLLLQHQHIIINNYPLWYFILDSSLKMI